MQVLHERIKIARTNKGYSQKQMAEQLEISQPGYQQIESGKYPDMRISTFVKLCEILDVSADWLLGFIDTEDTTYLNDFYMDVINTIDDYGNDEQIDDDVAYSLIRAITRIKQDFDSIM